MERSQAILGAEILSLLHKHEYSLEQLTEKIYNNNVPKNIVRIYQCITQFLRYELVVPVYKNKQLKFRLVNNGGIKE